MKRLMTAALVALAMAVVCGALAQPAMAQMENEVKIMAGEGEKPPEDAKFVPDVFDIGVDGELFFRIRANAAGFSAAQRAAIVNTRIVHIISYAPVTPGAVRVEAVRGKPTIYVGNVRLITVYPSDVEATGAGSMRQLANIWAASTACCLRNIAPWARVGQ